MSDDNKRVKCAHDDCGNTFVNRVGYYWVALNKMYCSPQCQRRAIDAWFDATRERTQADAKQAEMFGNG